MLFEIVQLMELRQNLTSESAEMIESQVKQFTSLVHYFMKGRISNVIVIMTGYMASSVASYF